MEAPDTAAILGAARGEKSLHGTEEAERRETAGEERREIGGAHTGRGPKLVLLGRDDEEETAGGEEYARPESLSFLMRKIKLAF